MKIYISADIEGIAGIVNWDEATRWKPDYQPYSHEMMKEVQAACEGANNAGAKEIWIKDAHGVGRNLSLAEMPCNTKLIRSFSGHPYCMMQELDSSFDAALMIGYHSFAGSGESPLAHTIHTDLAYIKINGEYASEFLLGAYTAALEGVPVVFVSGDSGICSHVSQVNEYIKTVEVNKGIGDSVISVHPAVAFNNIKNVVEECFKRDLGKCLVTLPEWFEVELSFIQHTKAYRNSFYPGMEQLSPNTLMFKTDMFFEVLRMLAFVLV